MSKLLSISSDIECVTVTLLGIKIRFVRELKLARLKWHHYGFYEILKEYVDVPFIPRGVNAQHGWTPSSVASHLDIMLKPALELAWNKRFKDDWVTKSPSRCEVIGSPFVIYRRMHNIELAKDAKGTIAFPAHSLLRLKSDYDIEKYCAQLKALPEKFQPVTIALHPVDIEHWHMDEDFRKYGFNVVSAGLNKSLPYYEKFYDLLRRHRYATSNDLGSYTFYAVEMGIPFFLLGDIVLYDNTDGLIPEIESQVFQGNEFYEYGRKANDLFSAAPFGTISPEQRTFVRSELGLDDSISRNELRAAVIEVAAKEFTSKPISKHILKLLRLIIRHPSHTSTAIKFYKFLHSCRSMQH